MRHLILLLIATNAAAISFKIEDVGIAREEKNIIAVVDMDKVMEEHPYITKAKSEIEKVRTEREMEIKKLEKEIELAESEIILMEEEKMDLLPDTTEYIEISDSIRVKRETIQTLKKRIESKRKELDEVTKETEEDHTVAAMANIYKVIKEISDLEGIAVVVEKSSVLYGIPKIDITEKVIKMIKKVKAE